MRLSAASRRMNLLILGAGNQGHVVRKTAKAIGIFKEIAFQDDNRKFPSVLDTLANDRNNLEDFPVAFAAIGDNRLRRVLLWQKGIIPAKKQTIFHGAGSAATSAASRTQRT